MIVNGYGKAHKPEATSQSISVSRQGIAPTRRLVPRPVGQLAISAAVAHDLAAGAQPQPGYSSLAMSLATSGAALAPVGTASAGRSCQLWRRTSRWRSGSYAVNKSRRCNRRG